MESFRQKVKKWVHRLGHHQKHTGIAIEDSKSHSSKLTMANICAEFPFWRFLGGSLQRTLYSHRDSKPIKVFENKMSTERTFLLKQWVFMLRHYLKVLLMSNIALGFYEHKSDGYRIQCSLQNLHHMIWLLFPSCAFLSFFIITTMWMYWEVIPLKWIAVRMMPTTVPLQTFPALAGEC